MVSNRLLVLTAMFPVIVVKTIEKTAMANGSNMPLWVELIVAYCCSGFMLSIADDDDDEIDADR